MFNVLIKKNKNKLSINTKNLYNEIQISRRANTDLLKIEMRAGAFEEFTSPVDRLYLQCIYCHDHVKIQFALLFVILGCHHFRTIL